MKSSFRPRIPGVQAAQAAFVAAALAAMLSLPALSAFRPLAHAGPVLLGAFALGPSGGLVSRRGDLGDGALPFLPGDTDLDHTPPAPVDDFLHPASPAVHCSLAFFATSPRSPPGS